MSGGDGLKDASTRLSETAESVRPVQAPVDKITASHLEREPMPPTNPKASAVWSTDAEGNDTGGSSSAALT